MSTAITMTVTKTEDTLWNSLDDVASWAEEREFRFIRCSGMITVFSDEGKIVYRERENKNVG